MYSWIVTAQQQPQPQQQKNHNCSWVETKYLLGTNTHHHLKLKTTRSSRNRDILRNKIYLSIQGEPKTVFKPYPNPKNRPWGPQKVKNDPQIRSKSNVRIEGNMKNESSSTTWVDPKTVIKPYSDPQTNPLEPWKDKNDPQN